jgi:hypothetical protein
MGTFDERIRFLSDRVGVGNITAGVTVDQPYAQDQHENLSYKHDNGRAHFLGGPLMENYIEYMVKISRSVITDYGSRLSDEMRDTADSMAAESSRNAPVLTGDLKNSDSPWVKDNGVEIYRRPPRAARDDTPESGWHRD